MGAKIIFGKKSVFFLLKSTKSVIMSFLVIIIAGLYGCFERKKGSRVIL